MKGSFRTALIAAVVSAVVSAGAAVATTQAFTLGTTNRVNAPSMVVNATSNGVTNPVDAPLLTLNNKSSTANATPLSLLAASGHAPFTVNTQTRVTNLNADQLDGRSSEYFLPRTAKAADSDKLDGLSSESFTQGGGRLYSGHREHVSPGTSGTLLEIPNLLLVSYACVAGKNLAQLVVQQTSNDLYGVAISGERGNPDYGVDTVPLAPYTRLASGPSETVNNETGQTVAMDVMASRPFDRMTFKPAELVDVRATGLWDFEGGCAFQAVGQVFG